MKLTNVVIVGAGGTASFLAPVLAKLLAFNQEGDCTLTIIDEDLVEDKNLSRSYTEDDVGMNKAALLAEICTDQVPSGSLQISAIEAYVTPDNFDRYHQNWCRDGVAVFACVDNNVSRCFLEDQLSALDNAVYITPGNAEFDGQVHMYLRQNGSDVTPKITEFCPEMQDSETPGNQFPDEENCTEKYESEPQLILANLTAATMSLNLFWSQIQQRSDRTDYVNEILFDVVSCGARPDKRVPIKPLEPSTIS